MNTYFPDLLCGALAAAAGTAAFALLFAVERRHYLTCSLIGGLGWTLDSLLQNVEIPDSRA